MLNLLCQNEVRPKPECGDLMKLELAFTNNYISHKSEIIVYMTIVRLVLIFFIGNKTVFTWLHMLSLTSRKNEFMLLDVISSPRFKKNRFRNCVCFCSWSGHISHALFYA